MSQSMRTYQLTITEAQAILIARALDLWDRTKGGQFWDLELELGEVAPAGSDEALKEALDALHHVVFPHLGPGAGNFTFTGGMLAFNLRKVIEHAVSWSRRPLAKGEWGGVAYDGPIGGAWWEGQAPAVMLRFEGDEAVRVRERAKARIDEVFAGALAQARLAEMSRAKPPEAGR